MLRIQQAMEEDLHLLRHLNSQQLIQVIQLLFQLPLIPCQPVSPSHIFNHTAKIVLFINMLYIVLWIKEVSHKLPF